MKITIIGWYGTETIGDRAILAGLISFFNKSYNKFEIKLGSLYPFFSQRTIDEDSYLWEKIIGKKVEIDIFDSKLTSELDKAIYNSDLIIMGGGPLMHISEMYMIEYAFKKAKKLNKITGLMGCGVGPIFTNKFKKSLIEITNNSDLIILRDSASKENLKRIFKEFNKTYDFDSVNVSFDPAVECCIESDKYIENIKNNNIIINLREFPQDYSLDKSDSINEFLKFFIKKISRDYSEHVIQLIPMHYFYIGDDDRTFLNQIKFELNEKNIVVQNENLTLEETMGVYKNAYFNVGMRFHSIVLQTILSGKNFILDYTEPNKGKIFGFLEDIDSSDFYKNRYISLQDEINESNIVNDISNKFEINQSFISNKLLVYTEKLKEYRI
jgi:polysaccharide pyruvyl transferase WcaK-like protein